MFPWQKATLYDTGRSCRFKAQADLAEVEARIEELQARAAKLRAYIELASEYEASTTSKSPREEQFSDSPVPKLDNTSPFYGKSLASAAIFVLEQANEPLTAMEIAQALKNAGWDFVSERPKATVQWALHALSKKTGEVITTTKDRWALLSWRSEHVKKSIQGLKRAEQRGVHLGAPPKMTEAKKAIAETMLSGGASVAEIAEALGVAEITIKRYRAALNKSSDDDLGPNVTRLTR